MFRNKLRCLLVLAACLCPVPPVLAQQNAFPFDSELFLDTEPMPGSKRIPNMDIAADGAVVLEMWCNRVEGRLVVAADTVTAVMEAPSERPCTPEQAQRDADLLSALNDATRWRRDGSDLLLVGPRTLRFKPATH